MAAPRIGQGGVVTAKGDIMAFNGADAERLPVGVDGSRLEADSTQATGLRWVNSGPTDDVDIYVDIVGGSDITGDGSIGNPYQDYPRAIEAINVYRTGITFIHFKPGTYTGAQLPACQGPVILYADEDWDPAVFTDVFTGTTDAGTDANGITDAGLTPDDFNEQWLEVNGERKMVLNNTATRISPAIPFQTAFGAGENYRIFASAVRIVFTAAAFTDVNNVANGTGSRGTTLLNNKAQNPYVAFVGIIIADNFMPGGGNLVFSAGQYAAIGLRTELSDVANFQVNIDAADMWCGNHNPTLNALSTKTAGASLLWSGWGFNSTGDGSGSADLGAISVTGYGALFGVFSCAWLSNHDNFTRYSPALFEWYGGRIRLAEFGYGAIFTTLASAVQENKATFGGPNIGPTYIVHVIGGKIDLDNVQFEDHGFASIFLRTITEGFVRITSNVTGEAVGAQTVDIQGASTLVSDGAPALGGAGNDWTVGTAAAFNKAALANVNDNVASIGSLALRQS